MILRCAVDRLQLLRPGPVLGRFSTVQGCFYAWRDTGWRSITSTAVYKGPGAEPLQGLLAGLSPRPGRQPGLFI
jgi:hypothetical protein